MEIPGISSSDSSLQNAIGSTAELDQNAFMQLLVTQLENQDPLSPVQNEDFVAQLATFSSLSELENLNQNILAMITLNQSNALLSQLTQGSSLIGKQVSWTDPSTGEGREGAVDSVRIEEGLAILRIDGEDIPLAAVDEILGEPSADTEDGSSDDSTEDQSS